MRLKKAFNNNALLALDENEEEVIVMGKGIAFGKKSGDRIDESLIQKKFVFDKSELNEKFSQLFDEIPQQYVELTVSIVEMVNIPWWRSHPIHENRATESICTEPCNPLLRATKSMKRATSTY